MTAGYTDARRALPSCAGLYAVIYRDGSTGTLRYFVPSLRAAGIWERRGDWRRVKSSDVAGWRAR